MSTILEEGIGHGGATSNTEMEWERIKDKYPNNSTPSQSSKLPSNLDPALNELKKLRNNNDEIMSKNIVPQKVNETLPENESKIDVDSDNTSQTRKCVMETKRMIENFRDSLAKYPKYISYEGSMILCVLLAMKSEAYAHISSLPSNDYQVIRSSFPSDIALNDFMVKFDEEKNFVITFKSIIPISITFLNAVAHPRPEDLKSVSTGDVPVEKEGDKIAVGGKIILNKKGIKRLIGVEPLKRDMPRQEDEDVRSIRQPVAGRNAYEIRADVLQMALDYTSQHEDKFSDDEVLDIARKFYSFVENKR